MPMRHYLTVEVEPGSDVSPGFVFCQLVDQLRSQKGIRFALAFPDAAEGASRKHDAGTPPTIGERCQIFGSEADLTKAAEVARGFSDYVFVGRIRPVPENTRYVVYERVRDSRRTEQTVARELRRAERRVAAGKRVPIDQAEMESRRASTKKGREPFLMAKSHSTGQVFALTFRRRIVDTPVAGFFDSFGFSKAGASVPYLP